MKKTLPAMAVMEVAWGSVAFLALIYGLPLYILVRVIMMIRSHLRRRDEESRLVRLELGKIGHELEAMRKAQSGSVSPKSQE
ncbi:MAG: hypothetical protein WC655_12745 [Candidatus Hydrogenedentales bacterium]|jgi:hypothetical protein